MITALRTTLKSVTLNTNLATATAPTTLAQPTTLPTLSGDKLRTMLNSSRASGDPVLVAPSVSTAPSTSSKPSANGGGGAGVYSTGIGNLYALLRDAGVFEAVDWQTAAAKWKESQKQ